MITFKVLSLLLNLCGCREEGNPIPESMEQHAGAAMPVTRRKPS